MWWPLLIMSVLALGVLMLGWRLRKSRQRDRRAINIQIAQQQLADLQRQRERGDLDEAAYQQAYTELLLSTDDDLNQSQTHAGRSHTGNARHTYLVLAMVSMFVLVAVPLIYFQIGNPLATQHPVIDAQADRSSATAQGHTESFDVMASRLEARLATAPEDANSWYLLGRTYMIAGNYPRAVLALQKVYEMQPQDVEVLLSYADAIAMLHDGRVVDKAMALAQQAHQLRPQEPTALWLIAMGYEQQGLYEQAAQAWQQVIGLLQDDPPRQDEARQRLTTVRARLGQSAPVTDIAQVTAPAPARSVTVVINLAPALAQLAASDDTVFVFARAASGPRQPLAAQRLRVADLPATITLDDSMAMSPTHKLSDHARIYVSARVSRTGNAMAQSGDLQGNSPLLELDKVTQPVKIVIDTQVN